MAKFRITPTIHSEKVLTVRLGGNASNTRANDNDVGKPVKLVGESRYDLCATGNVIEGVITSVETGVYDSFHLGGIVSKGYVNAVANGLEGTPGVGAIAVGDYVVATAPAAVQTATAEPLKVLKATDQAAAKSAPYKARVVSLADAGSGAVGTQIVIELL